MAIQYFSTGTKIAVCFSKRILKWKKPNRNEDKIQKNTLMALDHVVSSLKHYLALSN